jgi:hypothetical protein
MHGLFPFLTEGHCLPRLQIANFSGPALDVDYRDGIKLVSNLCMKRLTAVRLEEVFCAC